ncbi:STP1 protein [Plasmodium ovale wallikeri]|uniref:STP1 protein n=1 Tax=Plasmodium ovale wallikeri TaxID=864142 RepID=A0A1A9AST9_PLAOA|nr:STP1 protein [Plasmodium ovale wallikeri]
MADYEGYTTRTHDIPIEVFFFMITKDIKDLIHTYGHRNCGLNHEELCEKIKKIISQKKPHILRHVNKAGKEKFNNEWNSQKNGFFDKLFEEEGFINMCYPPKAKSNQNLQKLKSRHIQFCKDKDVRRAAVLANPEYNECVKYNSWINTETASLTREFLNNVSVSSLPTVRKYFITMEHPKGYDLPDTYRKSKLDCTKYNRPSKRNQQKPVAETPTNKQQPPMEPNITPGSQGKGGISVADKDSGNAKTKTEENIPPNSKPHIPDSQASSPSKIQTGDTSTFQDTPVKTEAHGSPVNGGGEKKESIPVQCQPPINSPQSAQAEASPQTKSLSLSPEVTSPTPAIQSVPEATPTTVKNTTSSQTPVTSSSLTINSDSSLNSGSPSPSYPHPPSADTKDQDRAPQSSTTSGTLESTHSNQSVLSTVSTDSSLSQSQDSVLTVSPAVTTSEGSGIFISSSANAITTTTAAPASDTISTMITTKAPILSTQQAPSASSSREVPHTPALSGHKETTPPNKEHQPALTQTPTSLSGSDTRGISVSTQPVTIDDNQQASLSSAPSSITKDLINQQGLQSENSITSHSEYKPSGKEDIKSSKIQKNVGQTDTKHSISPVQMGTSKDHYQLTHLVNVYPGKISRVKPGKDHKNNPLTPKGKNDNPRNIPEEIPSLTHIIPTLLVILATVTLLFQLYKYTPFGLLLGRRRKRKKQDLKRIFKTPQKPTYESPNITVHELEHPNLVGQTVENDVYTKLLKINRYKQEMQKRKKENKKTLIEVHMEVVEEYKSDEWELHKGDFLEICLRGFINEENYNYQNFPNSKLTINNINEKTIEDIQKKDILWNNWIENHRNILEQWKKEEWFQILKNKWRNEEQMYKEKNDKLQENILKEQETHSIVSQKEIWKQWISKQATLIDIFNKEDWFKSMVYTQNKEKNNYHINVYSDISVTSKTELKNEKSNHEYSRSKDIIQKLMVQIHMMVLEECIKEEMIKHKELCIDNFIEDIHNQNNYDEKRNIPQCDTDYFNVL